VCKLLCFSKDTYECLKLVIRGPGRKGLAPSSLKKQKFRRGLCIKAGHKRDNVTTCYEPAKIWGAYDSDYWQWRRVKAWFKEFREEYNCEFYSKKVRV